jgi:hypothetical protein
MYTRKPLGSKDQDSRNKKYNRANDVRRDDDTIKDLSLGFQDIDSSIQYYFDNVIRPQIVEAGSIVKVPVVYGSPERWKNLQKDGYFRDKVGKILTPLIAYQRGSITRNRALGSKIDGNYPELYYTVERQYSQKNKYDAFSVLTGAKPIKEYYNIIIPEYVDITYNVVIWTNYVEEMNKIVESVLYSEGAYWGNPDRFKFRTKIDSYTNTTDLLQDDERIVRTTFDLTIYGYIVSDALVKQLSEHLSARTFSQRQIQVKTEAEGIGEINLMESGVEIETQGAESIENRATKVTTNTATFAADFLDNTIGVDDFVFKLNGNPIPRAAILSFANTAANTCLLTVDVAILGTTLSSSDVILAIGKFLR